MKFRAFLTTHGLWMLFVVSIVISFIHLSIAVPRVQIAGIVLLVISGTFFFIGVWRNSRKPKKINRDEQEIGKSKAQNAEVARKISGLPGFIVVFEYEALAKATNAFSRQIGKGAFGTVYLGTLQNGKKVAVKRLNTNENLSEEERDKEDKAFYAEVAAIGVHSHCNLVALLGVCIHSFYRILVYEFMENGSLDTWIFGDIKRRQHLDWNTRREIALQTARGLSYLHEESTSCVIHMDIKPANVLLDEFYQAKVHDFGLARSMKRDFESRFLTGGMRGTPGFMAPEWLHGRGITAKSDVFSYGVLLLELVSGRRCVDHSCKEEEEERWYLPSMAFEVVVRGAYHELVDGEIGVDESMLGDVAVVMRVALWCIQSNPAARPRMSGVVRMLEGDIQVLDPPTTSLPFVGSTRYASFLVLIDPVNGRASANSYFIAHHFLTGMLLASTIILHIRPPTSKETHGTTT